MSRLARIVAFTLLLVLAIKFTLDYAGDVFNDTVAVLLFTEIMLFSALILAYAGEIIHIRQRTRSFHI